MAKAPAKTLDEKMFCTIGTAAAMAERAVQESDARRAKAMHEMALAFESRIKALEDALTPWYVRLWRRRAVAVLKPRVLTEDAPVVDA